MSVPAEQSANVMPDVDTPAAAKPQDKAMSLPSELWRVVLSKLRLGSTDATETAGSAGQADLAVAMRVCTVRLSSDRVFPVCVESREPRLVEQ